MPPEMLALMVADAAPTEAEDDDGPVEILHENAAAARVFFAMGTQWRTVALSAPGAAMIVRTALDYAALPVVAAAHKVEIDAALLDKLQVLESEAAAVLAERLRP